MSDIDNIKGRMRAAFATTPLSEDRWQAVLDVLHANGYRRCAEGQGTTQWCDRANKAEDALLRKGYRLSCDIPACNCGDQWNHGGHAEMRLSEIGEALEQAVARRNGQTILADVVHALACLDRAEGEVERLQAALREIGKHPESCGDDCVSELARQDVIAERDALRAELNEIASVLPGVAYMDPPDGGSPSIPEQFRRMRADAERYRVARAKVCIVGDAFHVINLRPTYVAPDAAIEFDAAIDAARGES